jgi:hypothetical protein
MDEMGGCGWTALFVIVCVLLIAVGFFFHIGWNLLDYVVEHWISN